MPPSCSLGHKIVIHFQGFGPYHLARFASAKNSLSPLGYRVLGLETASFDLTYQWKPRSLYPDSDIHTLFPSRVLQDIPNWEIKKAVIRHLDSVDPSIVVIAGWATADALACLNWCRSNQRLAILMSETRYGDGPRHWFRELIKSRRVRSFSAALVGGRSHFNYLRSLGFLGPIQSGYNVVDNDYFCEASRAISHSTLSNCPYLLASNRFVERKNLLRLLEAFAVASSALLAKGQCINLCLLGDGEQASDLFACCSRLGLRSVRSTPWQHEHTFTDTRTPIVFFPGFQQIEDLPRFYASATAFIHPALSEPWGLVINEAMASSLPVLASSNVGAAEELLLHGQNGFLFDPLSIDSIAEAIDSLFSLTANELAAMRVTSFRQVEDVCPQRAFGIGLSRLLTALN